MHNPDLERVLKFWLEDVGPDGWYAVRPELDARCESEFNDLRMAAMAGGLDSWMTGARGSLALLILLDQFSRNIGRGTAAAFAADPAARRIAISALKRGHDLLIEPPARQFMYMPLMHSEILADQERCVRLFLLRMPGDNLPHAIKHRAVIRRFGRFPSRNAALGRKDSAAELAYRAEGGYMS